jgi:hypothetical protein
MSVTDRLWFPSFHDGIRAYICVRYYSEVVNGFYNFLLKCHFLFLALDSRLSFILILVRIKDKAQVEIALILYFNN